MDENLDHKIGIYCNLIGPLAALRHCAFLCQKVLRYFGKVRHKSNVRIIQYDWLIVLYIFIPLVRIASFLIVKNSSVREELTDILYFHKTQLQQITVEEHIFGEFALATLTFGPCTSTSDNFHFT